MKPVIHFSSIQFDIHRLEQELKAVENITWHQHFAGDYYQGEWKAAALYAPAGEAGENALLPGSTYQRYEKTQLLAQCPYINEIIESFHCPKQRVRLMRLAPGAHILPHNDPGYGWSGGLVRLHIPITSNDQVMFKVDNKPIKMKPGQLWYVDFQHRHEVKNAGATDRVHLVMDLEVNEFLKDFFPKESPLDRLTNVLTKTRFALRSTLRDWYIRLGLARLRQWFSGTR